MTARPIDVHALPAMLTALRLPSFHRHWPALAERADKEGWPAARFLAALAEIELAERETRRIRRHLLEANLPAGKTLATFDFKAIPSIPRARVEALAAGDWLETGANLIAIGNSGAGKTHLLSAIAHALVEAGRRVLYTRTTDLVQKLQAARRDLVLEPALAKLDRFDLVILDDIAYAQKDHAETSVLFELIAIRSTKGEGESSCPPIRSCHSAPPCPGWAGGPGGSAQATSRRSLCGRRGGGRLASADRRTEHGTRR